MWVDSLFLATIREPLLALRLLSSVKKYHLGTSKSHDHDILTLHQPIRLQHFERGNEKVFIFKWNKKIIQKDCLILVFKCKTLSWCALLYFCAWHIAIWSCVPALPVAWSRRVDTSWRRTPSVGRCGTLQGDCPPRPRRWWCQTEGGHILILNQEYTVRTVISQD